jgi:hemoglobin
LPVSKTVQPTSDSSSASLPTEGTMYDWIGGETALRKLVDRFYDIMDSSDYASTIRAMHKKDLSAMRASLFEYLSGWLGGPPLYIIKNGSPCITQPHSPFAINQTASDAWVRCISQAMLETGIPEQYRRLLAPAFERVANSLINSDC